MGRHRLNADEGYSLVELLVAILIVSILTAVGLAAYLNQRTKAQDVGAKSAVVTAAKAITAYGTDHGGYANAAPSDLVDIERSLGQAMNLSVTGDDKSFSVTVASLSG